MAVQSGAKEAFVEQVAEHPLLGDFDFPPELCMDVYDVVEGRQATAWT